jgi:hypothetical protein
MDEPAPKQWKHRKGDEYAVICARYVGNERDGFACEHTRPYHPTDQLSHAISQGFTYAESDDFNVGVIRKGRLVATLWMNDIVDDDPVLMASIAKEVGLEVASR